MSPKVSVIIPTYNRAVFLECAIKSVLQQTLVDFELIIVDDGSSDNTTEVLQGYKDSRIHVISQSNSGRSAARNTGVSASSGDYLAFLDDDDEFLPRKLEIQVDHLDGHPSTGLVAGGYERMDSKGTLLDKRRPEPWHANDILSVDVWLRRCPFLLQSVLLRRHWWAVAGGLDPILRQCEDHDLFLRLADCGCSMEWIREPVFRYRYHETNTVQDAFGQTGARIHMLDKFFASPNAWSAVKSELYAYHWATGALHAYAVGQIEQAKVSMTNALAYDSTVLSRERQAILGLLASYAVWPLQRDDPRRFLDRVFENLPDKCDDLRESKGMVLARVEMSLFFKSHEQGKVRDVLQSGIRGVLHDPRWLLNRGVWAIFARNLACAPRHALRKRPSDQGGQSAVVGKRK